MVFSGVLPRRVGGRSITGDSGAFRGAFHTNYIVTLIYYTVIDLSYFYRRCTIVHVYRYARRLYSIGSWAPIKKYPERNVTTSRRPSTSGCEKSVSD